jgi:membrane-bound metal-dependent hydrolase YbcI (DUF457 family)
MAAYREHLTTSCVLGIGVAAGAISLGFTPVQGVLAGTITGIGGILPDLDSESGRPVREVFGVTAALAPLVMMRRIMEWGGNTDGAMLLSVLLYVSVRYGGAMLLGMFAVHRGMYHSIPAMLIAGELAFLGYKSEQIGMKLLMGTGIMIGFFSHLLLDELYSVEWRGMRVKLNKFAGSAVKFTGKSWPANIFAYGLLFTLSYTVWIDGGLEKRMNSLTNSAEEVAPQEADSESENLPPIPRPQVPRARPVGRVATQDENWREAESSR